MSLAPAANVRGDATDLNASRWIGSRASQKMTAPGPRRPGALPRAGTGRRPGPPPGMPGLGAGAAAAEGAYQVPRTRGARRRRPPQRRASVVVVRSRPPGQRAAPGRTPTWPAPAADRVRRFRPGRREPDRGVRARSVCGSRISCGSGKLAGVYILPPCVPSTREAKRASLPPRFPAGGDAKHAPA